MFSRLWRSNQIILCAISGGSLEKLTHSLTYWCTICFLRFRVLFRGVPVFLGVFRAFSGVFLVFFGVFRVFLGVFLVFLGVFRVFWGCSWFFGCSGMFRDVPVFRVPVFRVPVFPCSGVPLFRCSAVPLFRCSFVPVFRCSSVPVFRCSWKYYMPFQIEPKLNLPRNTVWNIVDRFVRIGSVQPGVGGNTLPADSKSWLCGLVHGVLQAKQKLLIEKWVVLPANVPSQASISHVLTWLHWLINYLLTDLEYTYLEIKCLVILPVELLCMWAIFILVGLRTRIFTFVCQEITENKK